MANGIKMDSKSYRQSEGVSSTDLKQLMKTPMHFKYYKDNPTEDTPSLLFGRSAHKYILERDDFFNEFAIAPACDRRTKEGKLIYLQFVAECQGKEIITSEDFEKIKGMAKAIDENPLAKWLLTGETEMSFFWTDERTSEVCKCRPDVITKLADECIITDYKTTENAETEAFMKNAIKLGYNLQSAMYVAGVKANTGKDYAFVFVAQDKKPPYAINILKADKYFMEDGRQLFWDLLEIYHDCKVTDNWYGYTGKDNEVASLSLPNYLLKQFEGIDFDDEEESEEE